MFLVEFEHQGLWKPDNITGADMEAGCVFSVLLCLKLRSPLTSVASDLTATKFTSETPEVFC